MMFTLRSNYFRQNWWWTPNDTLQRIIHIPNITAGLDSSIVNLAILAESLALAPETSPWASGNEFELLVDRRFDFFELALSNEFPDAWPSPCTVWQLQLHQLQYTPSVSIHLLYMPKAIKLTAHYLLRTLLALIFLVLTLKSWRIIRRGKRLRSPG